MNKKEKLDIKIEIMKKVLLDKGNCVNFIKKEQEEHKEIVDVRLKTKK